ncbi:MAG: hypothetical protein ABI862_18115 [Ilumatobacteraceae bacterium]
MRLGCLGRDDERFGKEADDIPLVRRTLMISLVQFARRARQLTAERDRSVSLRGAIRRPPGIEQI